MLIFSEQEPGPSKSRVLKLVSTDGPFSDPIEINDYWPFLWLNNQSLLMYPVTWDEQNLLPATILDPFSVTWTEMDLALPDKFFYPGEILYQWSSYAYNHFVLDPTRLYVLYPALGEKYDEFPVRLYEIENESVLSEFITFDFYGRLPKWSPKGSEIAIISDIRRSLEEYQQDGIRQEIYTLNVDGEIIRETYLTENYDSVFIRNYTWSPDGSKIALWISDDPIGPLNDPVNRLTILDRTIGTLTDYCEFQSELGPFSPVWSPDSKQLLIGALDINSGEDATYLLDLETATLFLLEEKLVPVGWLKAP